MQCPALWRILALMQISSDTGQWGIFKPHATLDER
jgi:hypothetical protein